ncbi:CCD63 protein, partial [Piaya cayana]|nr:CCD63 protein [Piaya cayana]
SLSLLQQRGSSLRDELSDTSVPEKEMLAKAEIRKLQKKFRIEAEKIKSCDANTKRQMQAQEKEIELLMEKHKDLSVTLSLITSPRNVMLGERNCTELQRLFQTKSQYDSLIRDKKALLADLDKEILEMERKVVKQKQVAAKVKQENSSKQLQKRIKTLELHLNTVTVHSNTILSRNNELREQIRCLLLQKAVLDRLYLKHQEKLDQQYRRLNADVEQCEQAYQHQTDTLARISARRERRSREILQYNIKMQEQNHAFEQETKLRNFMAIKSTDRSELEERAQKKKALKAAQRAKWDQVKSVESREVVYRRLQELAEDGDIDRLLNSLVEKEQKNFSCFSYATEMNISTEKIQRRTQDLQKRIEALTAECKYKKSSNLHVLQELEKTLMKTTEEGNQYEDEYKKTSTYLGHLKSGMNNLFKSINYDHAMEAMHLEEDKHITDQKLVQFFGTMESKIKELLLMESILSGSPTVGSKSAQSSATPLLASTELPSPVDQTQLCPLPPALDSTTSTIDTLEVPLDHRQLSQLILQNWKKEQSNSTLGRKGRNSVRC